MKRVSSVFLLAIALDRGKEHPIYRQFYDWFQRAIGQLKSGQHEPSTHNLAAELNIPQIPVLNTLEQVQTGCYLQAFVGTGTCHHVDLIPLGESGRPPAIS